MGVRWHPAFGVVALASAVLLLSTACSGSDGGKPTPTPSPGPAQPSATVSTPTATVEVIPTPVPGPAFRAVAVAVDGSVPSRLGVGANASWAPDSSQVALASRDEGIVLVELRTGTRRIIRPGPCQWVDWAPDGMRLAVNCAGRVQILEPGGRELSRYEGSGTLHGWSPDGQRFAFTDWRAPLTIYDGSSWTGLDTDTFWFRWLDDGGIAVVSQPDEKRPATIRVLGAGPGYPITVERLTRAGAMPRSVSVSPDGKTAAYGIANPNAGTGVHLDGTVVLLDLGTGEELAAVAASAPDYPSLPLEFAPDGSNVLVQTDVCREWNLAVLGLDGTLRQIAGPGGFYVVEYSPDGSLVAFTRGTELWVVPSDGKSPPRQLATGIHGPAGFEWSPDGKWLAVPDFFGGFGACE